MKNEKDRIRISDSNSKPVGGKSIYHFPRLPTGSESAYVTKGLSGDEQYSTIIQELGNLLTKIGRRILIALSDYLHLKKECRFEKFILNSNHRMYLIKEDPEWMDSKKSSNHKEAKAYGLLGFRIKSYKTNGFVLYPQVDQKTNKKLFLNNEEYVEIPMDDMIGDYEVVVFVGNTLEKFTAGRFLTTPYDDVFDNKKEEKEKEDKEKEDHIYTHFELEVQDGSSFDPVRLLDGSIIKDIEEPYKLPFTISNDMSLFSFTTQLKRKFSFKDTNRKVSSFSNSLFQVPGYLIKTAILGQDSESE